MSHGALRLVQTTPTWLVKTRRAPSWHCRGAKVLGHRTTTAMLNMSTSAPHPPPQLGFAAACLHTLVASIESSIRAQVRSFRRLFKCGHSLALRGHRKVYPFCAANGRCGLISPLRMPASPVSWYVGEPRAYQDQFRGFKSHRMHARRDFFLHKKMISGKRESVS